MSNPKHFVETGPFAGLWIRTASTLSKGGFKGRNDVQAAITSGILQPFQSIRGYGKYAHREVLRWLDKA
jgi:hypothetical protein